MNPQDFRTPTKGRNRCLFSCGVVSSVHYEERHDNLLRLVKSQLKAIMEESVTKKFIHVESPHVLRLCGTIEQCLLEGIRKLAVAFYRNKIAYLFTRVGKVIPQVASVVTKIEEAEAKYEKITVTEDGRPYRPSSVSSPSNSISYAAGRKYLWIRMAITEKVIDKITEYLVANHSKFYEKSSIMADPIRGKIFSSLLVGPCALDYTKVKTHDHYWSDPPAEELLQRHKLHSRGPPSPNKRPALRYSNLQKSTSESVANGSSFRAYVESLHQNSKITLLYGKNNVIVEPEDVGVIPGYLSLHQESSRLMIKWTPNQLMYGSGSGSPQSSLQNNGVHHNGDVPRTNGKDDKTDDSVRFPKRKPLQRVSSADKRSISSYWDYAISADVQDIVYLHCHQQEKSSTLVLIGQDGVQWPPVRFPPGGQLLTFLTSLETALLPHGYLDPPLWSQKGKGKMFPRVRRKSFRRSESGSESDESTDFVFRVSTTSDNSNSISQPINGITARTPSSHFDLMQSIADIASLWNKSFAENDKKTELPPVPKPNSSVAAGRDVALRRCVSFDSGVVQYGARACQRCGRHLNSTRALESACSCGSTGTLESVNEFVPNLDLYTWDQDELRHHNDRFDSRGQPEKQSGSLKVLCESMRRQIISRAFYGWLAHCRHIACVRTHLTALVNGKVVDSDTPTDATVGVTEEVWNQLVDDGKLRDYDELARYVYFGGIKAKDLRKTIWLYLLGYYPPGCSEAERHEIDAHAQKKYDEIRLLDELIKQRVAELPGRQSSSSGASISSAPIDQPPKRFLKQQSSILSDVFMPEADQSMGLKTLQEKIDDIEADLSDIQRQNYSSVRTLRERSQLPKSSQSEESSAPCSSMNTVPSADAQSSRSLTSISMEEDSGVLEPLPEENEMSSSSDNEYNIDEEVKIKKIDKTKVTEVTCNGMNDTSTDHSSVTDQTSRTSICGEDPFSANLSQIDKDVYRCDRNHVYFTQTENLVKLGNIMSCFVWEHPDVAYIQGMCDLVAPLLVLYDNESLVYACFVNLMERTAFHKGNSMDVRLANLRSLIQVLDYELYEHLRKKTDDTHFFFCYRWFLLEFKRELSYDEDVFAMWERTWAARSCSTDDFGLFFGLAMLETYRDIILENEMDFSGIVKFFNEMAEKHDVQALLQLAQKFVADVQQMIQK